MTIQKPVDFNTPFETLLELARQPLPCDAQGQVLPTARPPLAEGEIAALLAPTPVHIISLNPHYADTLERGRHLYRQVAQQPAMLEKLEGSDCFKDFLLTTSGAVALPCRTTLAPEQIVRPAHQQAEYSLRQPFGHRLIGTQGAEFAVIVQPEVYQVNPVRNIAPRDDMLIDQLHEAMHVRQLLPAQQYTVFNYTAEQEIDAEQGAYLAFQIGAGGSPAVVARRLLARVVESALSLTGNSHTYWPGATPRELAQNHVTGGLTYLTALYNTHALPVPPVPEMKQWIDAAPSGALLQPQPAAGPAHAQMVELAHQAAAQPYQGFVGLVRGLQQHIERPQQPLSPSAEALAKKAVAAARALRPEWFSPG